jgi:transketolase
MNRFAKYNIGINSFGESGPGEKIYKHFKLDKESLKKRILKIIK